MQQNNYNITTNKSLKMKRLNIFLLCISMSVSGYSQVFHTGETLKRGVFSLGVEPAVFINGGSEFMLFFHGGYGIKNGIDLALKFGIGNPNYFGADLEWKLANRISLTTGAHNFGDFGLDAGLNFTIPIKSDVKLYTGFDSDIVFSEDENGDAEILYPLWIPIGVEIALQKKMSMILKSEIGMTDPTYHVIVGKLNFYY